MLRTCDAERWRLFYERYFNQKNKVPKGAYEESRLFDEELIDFYDIYY